MSDTVLNGGPRCFCGRMRAVEDLPFAVHVFRDGHGGMREAFCQACLPEPSNVEAVRMSALSKGWREEVMP